MKPEMLLFDLDGVILDSRMNMQLAWKKVREQVPEAPSFEEYFKHIGRTFPEIMKLLEVSEQAGTIENIFRKESLKRLDTYKFFDDMLEVLQTLRAAGKRIGVVTSKDEPRTLAALGMTTMMFDVIRTGSGKTRGKPAPDDLLIAMGTVGVDPMNTIYVGDMFVDYEASLRAGCNYAHAMWGYGITPKKMSVTLLQSPKDILQWADRCLLAS